MGPSRIITTREHGFPMARLVGYVRYSKVYGLWYCKVRNSSLVWYGRVGTYIPSLIPGCIVSIHNAHQMLHLLVAPHTQLHYSRTLLTMYTQNYMERYARDQREISFPVKLGRKFHLFLFPLPFFLWYFPFPFLSLKVLTL